MGGSSVESDALDLSVVVPAYNEARRMPWTISELIDVMRTLPIRYEVVVVENGSTDATADVVKTLCNEYRCLRLLRLTERGKGRAVQAGALASRGRVVMLCDADLSMPASCIPEFLQLVDAGNDVVVGSREGPGAVRIGEPTRRHVMGRVFNMLVRCLVLPSFHDTQCGFKAFHAVAARELFRRQTLMGWGFDVEILFLACRLGYQVAEHPIEWQYNAESKVRAVRDTYRMLCEIVTLRLNVLVGRYDTLPTFGFQSLEVCHALGVINGADRIEPPLPALPPASGL